MRYNTNTPEPQIKRQISHIENRWKQLNTLLTSIVSDAIQFLFLVNSGGCIAILTFIGTVESARQLDWPWYVLGIFFFGLICVGLFHAAKYHAVNWIYTGYQKDVSRFYMDEIDSEELSDLDDKRVNKSGWIALFAYVSFICFIAGGAVGFANYHQLINKKPVTMTQKPNPQKDHIPKLPPSPPTPQPPK